MKKKYLPPVLLIVSAAVAAAVAIVVPQIISQTAPAPTDTDSTDSAVSANDIEQFKAEYESLNDTVRESDGATYRAMAIPTDAKVEYLDIAEAVDLIKQGKGVLYIGANWCPWCRNAVPELLKAAKAYGNRTVYYLTLDDDKSNFAVEDGQLVQTKAGSEAYYELLEALSARLKDYSVTGDDGTKYDTGEKRVYMPYVVAVKDGEILSDHTGTVELDADQTKYDALTDAQAQTVYDIYAQMFADVYGITCSDQPDQPCD